MIMPKAERGRYEEMGQTRRIWNNGVFYFVGII